MTTHRSLNKLEFKAHMSIHNFTDVVENETHEARNRTRDRFGKSHALSNEDGTSRVEMRKRRLKALLFVVFAAGPFFCASAQADEGETAVETISKPAPRRSTDIQVGTENFDANSWLDTKFNKPEDKFGIPVGESTSIGFNDDGDPNVGTRF